MPDPNQASSHLPDLGDKPQPLVNGKPLKRRSCLCQPIAKTFSMSRRKGVVWSCDIQNTCCCCLRHDFCNPFRLTIESGCFSHRLVIATDSISTSPILNLELILFLLERFNKFPSCPLHKQRKFERSRAANFDARFPVHNIGRTQDKVETPRTEWRTTSSAQSWVRCSPCPRGRGECRND